VWRGVTDDPLQLQYRLFHKQLTFSLLLADKVAIFKLR
jgi:hypothetical protein